MKKLIGAMMIAGLVMTMTVWNVYADDGNSKAEAVAPGVTSSVVSVGMSPGGSFLLTPVHEQAYLTYLVKEYSPDTLDSWKEAFAKRDQAIEASRKQAEVSEEEILNLKEKMKNAVVSKGAVFAAEKIGDNSISIRFKDQIADGALTDDVIVNKVEGVKIIDMEMPAEFKARTELYQKFEQAVKNSNADEIKALLPELLKEYDNGTEQMKNMKFYVHKAVELGQKEQE